MFARGISSFTRTWTTAMTYHTSCTHRDTSHDIEARDQIPHPLCMGIKISHPRKGKGVKCPGYARGGLLKLRFDRYITSLEGPRNRNMFGQTGNVLCDESLNPPSIFTRITLGYFLLPSFLSSVFSKSGMFGSCCTASLLLEPPWSCHHYLRC